MKLSEYVTQVASFPKTVYPYESRPGLTRVRRRKAGPWVPVEQGENDA